MSSHGSEHHDSPRRTDHGVESEARLPDHVYRRRRLVALALAVLLVLLLLWGVVAGVRAAKQYMSFTGATPLQLGIAHALQHEQQWSDSLRDGMQARRDQLVDVLSGVGFDLVVGQGTYFLTADPRPLGVTDAAAWCLDLPGRIGVAAVPFAPFTDRFAGEWSHLVRFAFCKRPEVLDEAGRRLQALKG